MWLKNSFQCLNSNVFSEYCTCGWFLYKTTQRASELCDEGDHVVLLEDLLQSGLHVLVHVGFERVLQQDPPGRQDVVQPVRHAEHHPACNTKHNM